MSFFSNYDALLMDLDGTVWSGTRVLPRSAGSISQCPLPIVFITNNASKSAGDIVEHLRSCGIESTEAQVLTAAHAAVNLAQKMIPQGAKVLVVGAPSFAQLVGNAGFTVVDSADERPEAVLQGLSRDLGWAELTEAALAIRAGAVHIASNLDTSFPYERGLALGNGALVHAVSASTGVKPLSTGKPEPEVFLQAATMAQASKPLGVGDRLDTDIAGAHRAGFDSFHVLTGVDGHLALIEAPAELRPTYVAEDLGGLLGNLEDHVPGPHGGFTARVDGADVILERGTDEATSLEALLTVLEVAWAMDEPPRSIRPMSPAADRAVRGWR